MFALKLYFRLSLIEVTRFVDSKSIVMRELCDSDWHFLLTNDLGNQSLVRNLVELIKKQHASNCMYFWMYKNMQRTHTEGVGSIDMTWNPVILLWSCCQRLQVQFLGCGIKNWMVCLSICLRFWSWCLFIWPKEALLGSGQ